jgi:hypothetical protein
MSSYTSNAIAYSLKEMTQNTFPRLQALAGVLSKLRLIRLKTYGLEIFPF